MPRPSYVEQVVTALDAEIPGNDRDLLRLYALLVLTTGTATSLEDVHHAWALWRIETQPDHPDLVPFDGLTPQVQDYDRHYRDAIRRVAAKAFG